MVLGVGVVFGAVEAVVDAVVDAGVATPEYAATLVTVTNCGVAAVLTLLLLELTGSQSGVRAGVSVSASCCVLTVRVG